MLADRTYLLPIWYLSVEIGRARNFFTGIIIINYSQWAIAVFFLLKCRGIHLFAAQPLQFLANSESGRSRLNDIVYESIFCCLQLARQ